MDESQPEPFEETQVKHLRFRLYRHHRRRGASYSIGVLAEGMPAEAEIVCRLSADNDEDLARRLFALFTRNAGPYFGEDR